jgi:hypothetical protein
LKGRAIRLIDTAETHQGFRLWFDLLQRERFDRASRKSLPTQQFTKVPLPAKPMALLQMIYTQEWCIRLIASTGRNAQALGVCFQAVHSEIGTGKPLLADTGPLDGLALREVCFC